MSEIAKMLIESVVEARVVPQELIAAANGGSYSSLVDNNWAFWFEFEGDAVDFMNSIDVDIAAEAETGTSMNVDDSGGFTVYVPINLYQPAPIEEPVTGNSVSSDNCWDRPDVVEPEMVPYEGD